MNQFNFKSQICTTRKQSERLLALGIKAETADMSSDGWNDPVVSWGMEWSKKVIESGRLPAWSLGRLWELLGKIKKYECEDELSYPRISLVEEDVIVENPKSLWVRQSFISPKGVYENIINCLEELIKEGYFNKEYLV